MTQPYDPFARPLYVMCKPAGALCNLRCRYCYYLEKAQLYQDNTRHILSDELLERYISQYIGAQTMRQVQFCWHGGEALMRPLSFYKRVMELQQRYAAGRVIENCIQTNGTLLTPEWCRFFADNHWLVGVSIDGPQEFHDEYRRASGGGPSWRKVMQGISMLRQAGAEWNALAVVNDYNADYPLEFYHFFKDIGCHYLQFTPVVERLKPHSDGWHLASPADAEAPMAPFSVTAEQWGAFTCAIFDEWVRHDVGQYFVQLFDATLAGWCGVTPGVCTLSDSCGHAAVMEHNGDLYSCDHFVFPEYRLGNVLTSTITEMMYGERQTAFGQNKLATLPTQCKQCPYLFACHGECPKNRFITTDDGQPGLNYLCKGYRQYFGHVAPYMDFMKRQLERDLPPADIMATLR